MSETFADVLKLYRERRMLSQSKLGKLAGFDHSYISRLESGTRTPTRDAVERIVEVLSLRKHEAGHLLIAAGFMPRNPLLAKIDMLMNADQPEERRDDFIACISAVCNLWEAYNRGET